MSKYKEFIVVSKNEIAAYYDTEEEALKRAKGLVEVDGKGRYVAKTVKYVTIGAVVEGA